mmetsp:Transcript_2141/g.4342  ORF Transcript_2141/g.4342 Transcript_2141/m.4342 type:complete len:157 (-) Transcript_2141:373-843(-)
MTNAARSLASTIVGAVLVSLAISSVCIVSPVQGFSVGYRAASTRARTQHDTAFPFTSRTACLRLSSPDNGNGNASSGDDANAKDNIQVDAESPLSLWDKVNKFLDTPILDANNRSDQGAIAETLKEFVRDEPELAQVTFSVVVVVVLVLGTRLVIS